jgi:hypothetical protein
MIPGCQPHRISIKHLGRIFGGIRPRCSGSPSEIKCVGWLDLYIAGIAGVMVTRITEAGWA